MIIPTLAMILFHSVFLQRKGCHMFAKMQEFLSARHTAASCARSVNSEQEIKWYQDISLLVIVAAFLILLPVSQFVSPPTVHAAATNISCGGAMSGSHCYAEQWWNGAMNGARTDIKVAQMTCIANCLSDGFVDNEMWVDDHSSCSSNKYGNCWVEAGYIFSDVGRVYYFWADVRPVDGNTLNFHYIGQVFTNDYGHSMRFSIYSSGTKQFTVDLAIQGCSSGCFGHETFYSTNNSMSPNDIKIGSELAGTGPNYEWHADRADYTNNYWRCGSNWCGQTYGNGPGIVFVNGAPPPNIQGTYGSPGGTGGDFYTNCC